jgi:hypothetical protein
MPFFINPALWASCCAVGILTLLFRRTRFLASLIILGSTAASLSALLLLIAVMLAASKVPEGHFYGSIAMVLASLVVLVGTIAGGIYGMRLGKVLNNRLGLAKNAERDSQI